MLKFLVVITAVTMDAVRYYASYITFEGDKKQRFEDTEWVVNHNYR